MSKVLTCEKLTKVYGKEKTALDGIDLELDFGRIVGLLGAIAIPIPNPLWRAVFPL